ncbi:hypothetical protein D3C73_1493050 [compost metagenome]
MNVFILQSIIIVPKYINNIGSIKYINLFNPKNQYDIQDKYSNFCLIFKPLHVIILYFLSICIQPLAHLVLCFIKPAKSFTLYPYTFFSLIAIPLYPSF